MNKKEKKEKRRCRFVGNKEAETRVHGDFIFRRELRLSREIVWSKIKDSPKTCKEWVCPASVVCFNLTAGLAVE